jgi:hypothetical protein
VKYDMEKLLKSMLRVFHRKLGLHLDSLQEFAMPLDSVLFVSQKPRKIEEIEKQDATK